MWSFLPPIASLHLDVCPSTPAQTPEGQTALKAESNLSRAEIVSLLTGCNKDLMGHSWAGKRGRNVGAERGRTQRRETESSDLEGNSQTEAPQRKVQSALCFRLHWKGGVASRMYPSS